MEEIAPMIATIVLIWGTVLIVKSVSGNRRLDKLAVMHNELQKRILDKFGSTQEMVAYLGTEPGKRLLDAPVIERGSPYSRILGSIQSGIVLALGGLAFLTVRSLVGGLDDTAFTFLGVLGLALGIGFLLSGWAAHALSKSYGLINGHEHDTE